MADSVHRVLPVVRWLQIGTAAAGLGMAIGMASVAAPAVAWADDDSSSSSSGSAAASSGRAGESGAAQRSSAKRSARTTLDAPRANRPAGPARAAAASRQGADDVLAATSSMTARPAAVPAVSDPVAPDIATPVTSTPPVAVSTSAKAIAAAVPSAAPGLGSGAATVRLNLEDLFSGTGKPVVTNPTAVVTGLFQEVLRRDPTAAELENYLRRLNISGVNGVVAGLYNSQAFRQNAVNNYYLELLGRTPTQQELSWGTIRLTLGTAPNFAASLAGSKEFYNGSASGGGVFGTQPSADTYVNLLFRALLGEATPPNSVDPLVTQIQAGLPIAWAANQFVNADAYRTVKVEEVYQVLGQAASVEVVDAYVSNWLWNGGQAGISMSLLATAANIGRIEAGLVTTPDSASAAVLQQLLLAPYIDGPTGFNAQYKALIGDCSDTGAPACKNPDAYALIKSGGAQRGIPNSSISTHGVAATVANMVPTQNEINLVASLDFPLQHSDSLENYFKGGIINHPNGPVITANEGTYIVDGHHRWSAIYLINPNTQVIGIDLGYVPTPQTALRESQLGIVATTGVLKESAAGQPNVYTVGRDEFDAFIETTIGAGSDPAAVIATFGTYISTKATWATLTDAEKMSEINDYMWNNVLRMRDKNPFIPGAPSRVVMPQFAPILPIIQNLDGGSVSYGFPTISYLG